jgi:predicted tellurium resistance membrane protein TerC
MDLFSVENLLAFLTLTVLEIVLGIDNIVFISIMVAKLEEGKQALARRIGLFAAMGMRVLLLLAISWIMLLTEPLFSLFEHSFSGRDLILLVGGVFLIAKSTSEIHENMEGASGEADSAKPVSFLSAIIQIALLDIIFSLDSVITAVGMADDIRVMIAAVVIAILVMLVFSKSIGVFIEENPTFKMLALSFLLLIGVMLVADGFGRHVEKGYLYFAIGFSLFVEFLNIRTRRKAAASTA